MVEALFTAGNSVMGRTIRKETGEPVSHVALRVGDWVIHSNLLGMQVTSWEQFSAHSNILYTVEVDIPDTAVLFSYLRYHRAGYDFGALAYLALRLAFGWLPAANLWQQTGRLLCTEWATYAIYGTENHTITPYQLYLRLTNTQGSK